jgi:hypothetical protein
VKLIITIDTEEDNWAHYSTTDNPVENIEKIVQLQSLFDRYKVKPTYLITYPVATNPRSVAILKAILDAGKCEIGTHCHPWNTPPFEEEINERNSMLCNLPEDLVYRKLECLHEVISNNFDVLPVSFRAGRWGFGSSVARSIARLGYMVDSSVSPFVDWSIYHGPDFSAFPLRPYRFDLDDISTPLADGALLELPVTVGFLQGDFVRCQKWTRACETPIAKKFHLKGILNRVGLLENAWLSPEQSNAEIMIRLALRIKEMKLPCLNMSFHSTTLEAGLSPFVKNREDEMLFLRNIEKLLVHASKSDWTTVWLKEMAVAHNP